MGPSVTRRALLASLGATTGTLVGCSSLTAPDRQQWSYSFESTPWSAPVVTHDTVLVLSTLDNGGRLTAIGRDSGEERWSRPVNVIGGLAFHEASGTVLASDSETLLVGYDAVDGTQRFTTKVGEPELKHPLKITATETGFVALLPDGGLRALNTDGSEQWRIPANVRAPLASGTVTTVAAERDPDNGELVALRGFRTETGEDLFRVPSERLFRVPVEALELLGIVVNGDSVYTATPRDGIRCLDAADGSERWHFGHPTRHDLTTPPLVVADAYGDTVYAGSAVRYTDRDHGTIFDVSDGRAGWEYRTETGVQAVAAGDPDSLFAVVGDSVRGLARETMTQRWSVPLDASHLAAAGDTCYAITTEEPRLVAVRGSDGN